MYEDMMRFFNSEQWRVMQIQLLLKRQEQLDQQLTRGMTPKQKREFHASAVQEVVNKFYNEKGELRE